MRPRSEDPSCFASYIGCFPCSIMRASKSPMVRANKIYTTHVWGWQLLCLEHSCLHLELLSHPWVDGASCYQAGMRCFSGKVRCVASICYKIAITWMFECHSTSSCSKSIQVKSTLIDPIPALSSKFIIHFLLTFRTFSEPNHPIFSRFQGAQ